MRSFNDIAKFQSCVEAQVVTADVNGSSVDLKNFGVCRFLANVGNSGDTLSGTVYIELELEESDDNSSFTDVADADVSAAVSGTNDGCFAVIDAPTEDRLLVQVEYRGTKRYVRPVINVTGTHSNGTPIAIDAALGEPVNAPVS